MDTGSATPTGVPTVEEILARPDPPLSAEGQEIVRRAYALAEDLHKDQHRKSGEPYFVHCAQVALLIAEIVNDWATIAAGLLHDTIEDCGMTVERLAQLFPAPIPELVDGVSKISSLNFSSDQEHQAGSLRKMILAMARDVRVMIIKLCDRLHNMRTLIFLSPPRQKAIAQSTLDIYAPLANRLGMTRIRSQLEDLSMRYLYPTAFTDLATQMEGRAARDQRIVEETRNILEEECRKLELPAKVNGRRKHLYSLYLKMQRQGLRLDEVHDILAIRVVSDTIPECYEILGVVHALWRPVPGRFKDYIATPKENGYRSIHTSVIGVEGEVVEIQIRTREMHRIAEEGIASHWKYKEGARPGGQPQLSDDEKRLTWLRSLVDWLQDVHDPSEFMNELKRDVFQGSVFCYTPRGDIIELPHGSTALDLAFRIHTDVGFHCTGARINNRMVSIRTEVKTGDIVEIATSKAAHPTPDWLQFAQSGRAKNKIRHWLKESQHGQYLEQGRRLFAETLKQRFGSQIDNEKALEILTPQLKQFAVDSFDDLMVDLGCGTVKIGSLIGRIEHVLRPAPVKRVPRVVRRERSRGKDIILVDGQAGAVTRMAQCCSPLPGDPIIGFITQGRGISIHRTDCKSLERIRDRAGSEGRVVEVEWGDASRTLQKAAVRIVCNDRKGLLSDISSAITQLNISIVGAHTSSNLRDNRAIFKIIMLIEDTDQLNKILSRLEQIPGVVSLSRVLHSGK